MKLKKLALSLALSSPAAFASLPAPGGYFLFCIPQNKSDMSMFFYQNQMIVTDDGSSSVEAKFYKKDKYLGSSFGLASKENGNYTFNLGGVGLLISFNGETLTTDAGVKFLVGKTSIGKSNYDCLTLFPSNEGN